MLIYTLKISLYNKKIKVIFNIKDGSFPKHQLMSCDILYFVALISTCYNFNIFKKI